MNSIKKGKRAELHFAHLLSAATSVTWHRVPQSGGAVHNPAQAITDKRFRGDLFCEDPRFLDIVVESKCRKAPVTLNELGNPKSEFSSWIKQTRDEAGESFWILMFQWNRSPIYLACPAGDGIKYPHSIYSYFMTSFEAVADIVYDGAKISIYRYRSATNGA
jgi:hypothetical protein